MGVGDCWMQVCMLGVFRVKRREAYRVNGGGMKEAVREDTNFTYYLSLIQLLSVVCDPESHSICNHAYISDLALLHLF